MLANALWANVGGASAANLALVMAGAWGTCIVFAAAFERFVERPLARVNVSGRASHAG
jgi:hypothetical protein